MSESHGEIVRVLSRAQRLLSKWGEASARAVLEEEFSERYGISSDVSGSLVKDVLKGETSTLSKFIVLPVTGKTEEFPVFESRASVSLLSKAEKQFVIYGPASVAIVDREGDLITGPALKAALPELLLRETLSLDHVDLLPGKIVKSWTSSDGETYKTEVRSVTKTDLEQFDWLEKEGVKEGDEGLFVVGTLHKDSPYCIDLIQDIEAGRMRGFSISGQAISASRKMTCEDSKCKFVNVIEKMALSAVTICRTPMNPSAGFVVLQKSFVSKMEGETPLCDCQNISKNWVPDGTDGTGQPRARNTITNEIKQGEEARVLLGGQAMPAKVTAPPMQSPASPVPAQAPIPQAPPVPMVPPQVAPPPMQAPPVAAAPAPVAPSQAPPVAAAPQGPPVAPQAPPAVPPVAPQAPPQDDAAKTAWMQAVPNVNFDTLPPEIQQAMREHFSAKTQGEQKPSVEDNGGEFPAEEKKEGPPSEEKKEEGPPAEEKKEEFQKAKLPTKDAVETPLKLGTPSYPAGPAVYSKPSPEASTKPGRPEKEHEFPADSDRSKDAANTARDTGTRPSGYFQRAMCEMKKISDPVHKCSECQQDAMLVMEVLSALAAHAEEEPEMTALPDGSGFFTAEISEPEEEKKAGDMLIKPSHAHSYDFGKMLEQAFEKYSEKVTICKGASPSERANEFAHKVAYATVKKEFHSARTCYMCPRVVKQYHEPDIYFDVMRLAIMTGRDEKMRLTPGDRKSFEREFPVLKQFAGELLQTR